MNHHQMPKNLKFINSNTLKKKLVVLFQVFARILIF